MRTDNPITTMKKEMRAPGESSSFESESAEDEGAGVVVQADDVSEYVGCGMFELSLV